jgi:ATP-dependent RNA helicase DeaD
MPGFLELGLSPRVLRAIEAMGYEEPTPVQVQAIPRLLAGKDVVVQAQTGTGKTAAFGIPIAERVNTALPRVQALVLSPTRELALQVASHLTEIGQFVGMTVLPIYGGQGYEHQIRSLRRGVHVVVATPGRLLDLLQRRSLTLDAVRHLVLDEADEMLDMGFLPDVERILRQTPAERQTTLFSATMPDAIFQLAARHLKQPERITLSQPRAITVPTVEQSCYLVPREYKAEALVRLLDTKSPQLALVFCATKRMAAALASELQGRGYRAEALHGDMTQPQRESVMEASRAGRVEVLVATDVAARGLDISEVSHVINFDIPQDGDRYVHRIGRTARAGRSGEAITLVGPREFSLMRVIENTTGVRIPRKELPTVAEAEEAERAGLAAHLEQLVTQEAGASFKPLIERLAQQHNPVDLAAAALSMTLGPGKERQDIPKVSPQETAPPPPGYGGRRGSGRSFGPRRGGRR